jgi:hypothetical protein
MVPHEWCRYHGPWPEDFPWSENFHYGGAIYFCNRCGSIRFEDWGTGGGGYEACVQKYGLAGAVTDPNDDCDLRVVLRIMIA